MWFKKFNNEILLKYSRWIRFFYNNGKNHTWVKPGNRCNFNQQTIFMRKISITTIALLIIVFLSAQQTQKPPLHGSHWMAITGKPLAATAGAAIFQKGGNAVDAACAMLTATCTMWDVLSWGGETQALIYNPKTKKVIGINALRVAPTGATAAFFKGKGLNYPPEYGPLAAVTPGTPGGLCTM